MLVFVYGTLKKDKHNHYLWRNSKFLGTTSTEPIFALYDGPFPIVETNGSTAIHGEVYDVNDETLERLRILEGVYQNWYKELEVNTDLGKCIMYVQDKGKSGRTLTNLLNDGIWN